MKTLTISVRQFQAVSLFAPKTDVRYYLNGIAINEGHLVATNGSYLFAIPIENSEGVAVVIPIETATALLKQLSAKEKRDETLTITIRDTMTVPDILLTVSAKQMQTMAIDGRFPDWRRIIPTIAKPKPYSYFDWSYMALFDKASKILRDSKHGKALLTTNGLNAALVEVPYKGPKAIGVLMPCRGGN